MPKPVVLYNGAGEVVSSSAPAVSTEPKTDPTSIAGEALLELAESAREAGCYTFIEEVWTVDPHHQDLTRQIREEADPRYVPLLCHRVYLSPAGTQVSHTYHVIGRYIEFPTEEYREAAIHLSHVPMGFPFPSSSIHPLRVLWALWEKGSVEYNNNTPPARVSIGPWLVEQMRALRKFFDAEIRIEGEEVVQGDFTSDKTRAILEAESARDLEMVEAARQEARYRMRHNWRHMKEAADNGRWTPEPPDASPFLDLGRKDS